MQYKHLDEAILMDLEPENIDSSGPLLSIHAKRALRAALLALIINLLRKQASLWFTVEEYYYIHMSIVHLNMFHMVIYAQDGIRSVSEAKIMQYNEHSLKGNT